jgi:hypothetical protein
MANELGIAQYVPRQQYGEPLDVIARSMSNLEAKHYEALNQRAAIASSLEIGRAHV